MKIILALAAVLLLAGCAGMPKPPMTAAPHKAHVAKAAPAAVTPNATVKKRFWDHFPKHPKFFH